ncbi:DUF6328 family protein [Kineococcus xinjiangensis]|uniref:DUF6328 family protein n=1 Tax=Kineococcus xinjiangensis TaxID=512762 RepID=UPI001FEB551D|nr:DUF6328 family protein [Kineococcus xinjiangensis]
MADEELAALRNETPAERMDRNWGELLQELRVVQTGVQILAGFLITLPFQARFEELDQYQRTLFLVALIFALAATSFFLAPVSLHRMLFRRNAKARLVTLGDRFAKVGLVTLVMAITTVSMLVADVVLGRTGGWIIAGAMFSVIVTCWYIVPLNELRCLGRQRAHAD